MATNPKITSSSSLNRQDNDIKSGTDEETGQSTDSHSAVEQLESAPNPLIEGIEGSQPREERGSIEGSGESSESDVERR